MSKGRLLVVDDEPSVLLTYTLIFNQNGYEVIGAASAAEAKELLSRETFDVLLCDLTLESSRGGFDVIEYARSRRPEVPVMLLTGFSTDEIADEAAAKSIMVMFKPVDMQEMLRTIRDLSRRS